MIRTNLVVILVSLCAAALLGVGGCAHPLDRSMEQMLQEQMLSTNRAYLDAIGDTQPYVQVQRRDSEVEADLAQRMPEIERISGPNANKSETLQPGRDLIGSDQPKYVNMSLERAIKLAVKRNLNIRLSRLVPGLRQTQVTQAKAFFDATAFANFNFSKQDTPQPPTLTGLGQFGTVQDDTRSLETGIRKNLDTGGQITVSTTFARNRRDPSFFAVKTFYESDVLVAIQQPLLRNFGQDVTRSQIMLTENAHDQSVADLKQTLLDTINNTEGAYWQLVFAHQQLLYLQRLLRVSRVGRDQVVARQIFDANAVQVSQLRSFVSERELDVIQAQQDVHDASDRVKALIYDPELSLAGEELIMPLDTAVNTPVKYNIRDAIMTALKHRPDLQVALSQIEDATIRQRVADNQRLPLLDLAASVNYSGVSTDDVPNAYDNLGDGEFIDYLLSLLFEMPIGNRAAEAGFEQRKIERRASVINYQRTVQNAVLEIKVALRELNQAYASISTARDARLAAADTVRALRAQVELGEELTPAFIDFRIRREETMTRNEIREVLALVEYNVAITALYRSLGTLLARNGIEFTKP